MANGLLNKASIILTSTGYKAGTLYNVAPVEAPYEDFDFARASVASRVNSSGLVEMVGRTLGSELVKNGDFSNGSSNWSNNDGSATFTNNYVKIQSNGTNLNRIRQADITQVGKTYKLSYEVIENNNVSLFKYYNGTEYVTTTSTVGTHTIYFIAGANDDLFFNVADTNTDDYIIIDNVSVKEIIDTNNIPRISYDSNGDNGHILLEPTSTNLIPYSEDFSQWSKEATVTLTPNYGISPDGTQNSTRMQMNADDSIYVSASSGLTASFYVKGTLGETIRLSNGSATTHTLTGNWDRVETYDSSSVSSLISINTYSGATARDVEIWGAQAEALSYATSYIPTLTGSTETRATETATGAGSADLINSTEGVLYAEIAALADDVDGLRVLGISDGGASNRVFIGYNDSNQIYANIGTSTLVGTQYTPTNASNFHKVALKYENNNCKFFVDGTQIGTTLTSITIPSGMNSLQFNSGAGGSVFYGDCKALAVFNEALSDSELTQLTT